MGNSNQPICLIDDDLIFGESFRRQSQKLILKNVETFNNFEEVRKAKNLDEYSCFVVDYDLEDETGIEVAKFLQEKAAAVPVIIVSATNRPWDERHDDLRNVKAFVSKWSGLNWRQRASMHDTVHPYRSASRLVGSCWFIGIWPGACLTGG